MPDDCVDAYEAWDKLNDVLEEQETSCQQYEGWKTAYKQIAKDLADGNFGTAAEETWQANVDQWNDSQCEWAADRIRNGDWGDAVDRLWECIDEHEWGE